MRRTSSHNDRIDVDEVAEDEALHNNHQHFTEFAGMNFELNRREIDPRQHLDCCRLTIYLMKNHSLNVSACDLSSHSKIPLKGSLLKLPPIYQKDVMLIQKCIRKAVYGGLDRNFGIVNLKHVQILCQIGIIKDLVLRDEIYCQLFRFTNKNPSTAECLVSFKIILCCLTIFPPSQNIAPYLHRYLDNFTNETTNLEVKSCKQYLYHSTQHGPRTFLPNLCEMKAISTQQSILVSVTCVDQKFVSVFVDTWTTIKDVKHAISKKLSIQDDTYFHVMFRTKDHKLEVILPENTRILEILFQFWSDHKEVELRDNAEIFHIDIVYKVKLYINLRETEHGLGDAMAVHLYFEQLLQHFVSGYANIQSEHILIHLAALVVLIKVGRCPTDDVTFLSILKEYIPVSHKHLIECNSDDCHLSQSAQEKIQTFSPYLIKAIQMNSPKLQFQSHIVQKDGDNKSMCDEETEKGSNKKISDPSPMSGGSGTWELNSPRTLQSTLGSNESVSICDKIRNAWKHLDRSLCDVTSAEMQFIEVFLESHLETTRNFVVSTPIDSMLTKRFVEEIVSSYAQFQECLLHTHSPSDDADESKVDNIGTDFDIYCGKSEIFYFPKNDPVLDISSLTKRIKFAVTNQRECSQHLASSVRSYSEDGLQIQFGDEHINLILCVHHNRIEIILKIDENIRILHKLLEDIKTSSKNGENLNQIYSNKTWTPSNIRSKEPLSVIPATDSISYLSLGTVLDEFPLHAPPSLLHRSAHKISSGQNMCMMTISFQEIHAWAYKEDRFCIEHETNNSNSTTPDCLLEELYTSDGIAISSLLQEYYEFRYRNMAPCVGTYT